MENEIKVTPKEVLDVLEEYEYVTVSELSALFECSPDTIRRKLRELRKSGEPIIHSRNGLSLIDKEILADPEKAEELAGYTDWILASFTSMVKNINRVKKLLPTMRKTLAQNTSKEERRELKLNCARALTMLTYVEAEEEEEALNP